MRSGPFGTVRLVLDRMDEVIADRDPQLARFSMLTANLVEPFVHAQARRVLPDVIATIRKSGFVPAPALDNIATALHGGLTETPMSRRMVGAWSRTLGSLIERNVLPYHGDETDWSRALGRTFILGARAGEPGIDLIDEDDGDDPRDAGGNAIYGEEKDNTTYQKVGSLERRPVSVNWPLFCVARKERRDELDGIDDTYIGSHREALGTMDNAIASDNVQVAGGWKADLFADLPKSHTIDVPTQVDMSTYTWRLFEREGPSGLLGELTDFINEQLEKKKDDLSAAAGSAIADALGGMLGTAGVPGIGVSAAKSVAKAIGEGFVDWVIKQIVEFTEDMHPFPPVTIGHLTLWSGAVPVSIVALAQVPSGSTSSALVPLGREFRQPTTADPNGPTRPVYADDLYNKKHDRWIRWWLGASQPAGTLPYDFMRKVHGGRVSSIVWRKSVQGFGAVVGQVNAIDDDGKYSVALRADVRALTEEV